MNGTSANRIHQRASGIGGPARRGAVLGLMAILLPVLAILAAFCVNLAQIQLTRTELMVATDAAARAGGRTFSELQTVEAAKTAAVNVAAMNMVDGEPLQLRPDDGSNEIEFGTTVQPGGVNGRYFFEKIPTSQVASGTILASAVRVHGRRDPGSLSGPVPLVIPGLLDATEFSTMQQSVAMQVDRDISLVLDRSGSMAEVQYNWGSNNPYTWGPINAAIGNGMLFIWNGSVYLSPGVSLQDYNRWAWEDYFGMGPYPTSPWEDLVEAVEAFLNVLEDTSQEEQVSVSSYASSATLDCYLEKNFQIVRNTVSGLKTGGMTAIGRGMQEGILTLLDAAARPYAAKTMVVMTDGIHNTGISPVAVASSLMSSYNLTIHTVTFGSGADQALMQQVATIGGGKHYHAANGEELVAIFEEIANNLPTILTQ